MMDTLVESNNVWKIDGYYNGSTYTISYSASGIRIFSSNQRTMVGTNSCCSNRIGLAMDYGRIALH